jgi:quercetin dioxygenase-like cupin family protein
MKRLFLVSTIISAITLGVALDRAVLAQQQQGMKRTILLRTDDPAAASQELILGVAEIQPGGTSGKHVHHGVEVGYVLEGTLSIEYPGKPALTLKPGDTFKNEGPHTASNPGKTTTKVLAAYLVEKGKPIADPAN